MQKHSFQLKLSVCGYTSQSQMLLSNNQIDQLVQRPRNSRLFGEQRFVPSQPNKSVPDSLEVRIETITNSDGTLFRLLCIATGV